MAPSRASTPGGLSTPGSGVRQVPLVDLYRPRSEARRCLESEVVRRRGGVTSSEKDPGRPPRTARGASRGWVYSPTTWYRPREPVEPALRSSPVTGFEVEALSLEDCTDFVVHLGLPADLAPQLFAELEAENSLLATESEANTSQDMEWLVSHFGPKIETRFLLFWPQMVPALRRCVDFGFEGAHGIRQGHASIQPRTAPPRPAAFRSRGGPPYFGQEQACVCTMEADSRPASEWGFERLHGPMASVTARRPPSQWGFERSHGPTDPSRFHPRHGPSGLSTAPSSPNTTSAGYSAFAGGFSPSFNSTRMAMALGAISAEPTEEDSLLYAEMGGGLFAPLASPRPPAGGRLRGGYRPFLRSDLDQYQAQVDEFREKSHCAAAAIRAGRRCNGPPAPAKRQRQLSARLARGRRCA